MTSHLRSYHDGGNGGFFYYFHIGPRDHLFQSLRCFPKAKKVAAKNLQEIIIWNFSGCRINKTFWLALNFLAKNSPSPSASDFWFEIYRPNSLVFLLFPSLNWYILSILYCTCFSHSFISFIVFHFLAYILCWYALSPTFLLSIPFYNHEIKAVKRT